MTEQTIKNEVCNSLGLEHTPDDAPAVRHTNEATVPQLAVFDGEALQGPVVLQGRHQLCQRLFLERDTCEREAMPHPAFSMLRLSTLGGCPVLECLPTAGKHPGGLPAGLDFQVPAGLGTRDFHLKTSHSGAPTARCAIALTSQTWTLVGLKNTGAGRPSRKKK